MALFPTRGLDFNELRGLEAIDFAQSERSRSQELLELGFVCEFVLFKIQRAEGLELVDK